MRAHLLPLLALLAPAVAVAEPIVLLPATGSNLHEGHLAAATDVLRNALERSGRFTVLRGALPAAGQEPTAAQAGEAARAASVPLAVTLHLARLGANASVRLAAYAPDGSLRHTDELGAGRPEDVEPVLRRLADGLASGQPARALARIDTVTERESDPYLKYMATNVFGIRLGGAQLLGSDLDGGAESVAGGGVFWLYDARSYLADVAFEIFDGDGEAHLGAISIGAYWPLSKGNVSPYVGGGLAYAWADGGAGSGSGLAVRGAIGLLVGRLSTVQLRAELGAFVNTFGISRTFSDEEHVYGPMFTVGLGY